MKKYLSTAFLILFSVSALFTVSADTSDVSGPRTRGFFFEAGAGIAEPSYDTGTELILSYLESSPGIERVKAAVDFGIGTALGAKSYLILRMVGTGDRVYDPYDYIQLNLYLYSLDARYYPFVTGFFLEGGGGMARLVLDTSFAGSAASDPGYGFSLGAGYDFSSKPVGISFALKLRVLSLMIEGYQETAAALLAAVSWK